MLASPFQFWDPVSNLSTGLARIDQENVRFRAFVAINDRDQLGLRAFEAATRRSLGRPLSAIDGVPVAVKDNIDTADMVTTMGSGLYAARRPDADATVVARLRAAGALIVGKANLTELACGTEGRNDHFGDVVNPAAPGRFAGGSSSGSAAAVAAAMVRLAVGTDTSCSIRNPAASCGVVGLKPTVDRVPTDGVSVCTKRLDHVGPMAADCADAAALLSVMQDPGWPDPRLELGQQPGPLRIGLLTGPFTDGCEPAVADAVHLVEKLLGRLGHQLMTVDLGLDLAETDGQANVLCRDMLEVYGQEVAAAADGLVGSEVRHWFSHYQGLPDETYQTAVRFQEATRARVDEALTEADVLVCPTARSLPGLVNGPDRPRSDRAENCSLWNLAGVPSLNVPVKTGVGQPPVGVLLNGARGSDGLLLALGSALEAQLRA